MARVTDEMLQLAVVGQYHQSLAVTIEAAGGIDPAQGDKGRQGLALLPISELRQHAIGFVD